MSVRVVSSLEQLHKVKEVFACSFVYIQLDLPWFEVNGGPLFFSF